jgi:hypothetical protein
MPQLRRELRHDHEFARNLLTIMVAPHPVWKSLAFQYRRDHGEMDHRCHGVVVCVRAGDEGLRERGGRGLGEREVGEETLPSAGDSGRLGCRQVRAQAYG